jgi:hypothetical protein
MVRKLSVFNNPDFRYYIAVIFFLIFCTVYVNYRNGGIIAGIFAGLQGIYNIAFITLCVIFIVICISKRQILISILIGIGEWIWGKLIHKKR